MSKKEDYIKKMEVDGTLYLGEVNNEHGEVFYVHFPMKQNGMISILSKGDPEKIFFQIGGSETDWETLSVVGRDMLVDGGAFFINSDEKKRLRKLLLSKEKEVWTYMLETLPKL